MRLLHRHLVSPIQQYDPVCSDVFAEMHTIPCFRNGRFSQGNSSEDPSPTGTSTSETLPRLVLEWDLQIAIVETRMLRTSVLKDGCFRLRNQFSMAWLVTFSWYRGPAKIPALLASNCLELQCLTESVRLPQPGPTRCSSLSSLTVTRTHGHGRPAAGPWHRLRTTVTRAVAKPVPHAAAAVTRTVTQPGLRLAWQP